MKCKYCASENVVKNGQQPSGRKKYHCKNGKRYFQEDYAYRSYTTDDNQILLLTKEGCGVRSTSRILNISPSTVIRRVMKIANRLKRPYPILKGKTYEVDELFTYVGSKDNRICVAYSYEPKTGYVIDISVGRRNKTNLKIVTETLILSEAKTICTDGVYLYVNLIPKSTPESQGSVINSPYVQHVVFFSCPKFYQAAVEGKLEHENDTEHRCLDFFKTNRNVFLCG